MTDRNNSSTRPSLRIVVQKLSYGSTKKNVLDPFHRKRNRKHKQEHSREMLEIELQRVG